MAGTKYCYTILLYSSVCDVSGTETWAFEEITIRQLPFNASYRQQTLALSAP